MKFAAFLVFLKLFQNRRAFGINVGISAKSITIGTDKYN
ncbi:hypothetical protein COO91_01681 [Nostoc flagelliforme CCNUN1]|uniref:Uncharacterized protein n=1 Tax=Nostoc flagelliforme CCNUN1 TaxID=2038116 RepID=A0A2K8SKA7_9NOSO|nr:hypothetical protein COO91_01681 [Nostoc flagelliforme CCNUN1]